MTNSKSLIFSAIFMLFYSCASNDKKSKRQFILNNKFETKKGKKNIENYVEKSDRISEMQFPETEINSEKLKKGNSLKILNNMDSNLSLLSNENRNNKIDTLNEVDKIQKKWSEAYSNNSKWLDLYERTSDAFLAGWSNEFQNNPGSRITKEELLFAYRSRMEKFFFETPSFIEFSASKLKLSEKLKIFISEFQANIE
jgi:hypothetical protein